jgi:GNAT superfamily N-acetyltransferase
MTQYYVGDVPSSAEGLLYNSYIRSAWDMGSARSLLRYSEFCRIAHERLEHLIGKSGRILLALRAEDTPEWVGGWLLASRRANALAVHFVYIKHPFRRRGWATALLDAALERANEPEDIVATIDIPRWRDLLARKNVRLVPMHEPKETPP